MAATSTRRYQQQLTFLPVHSTLVFCVHQSWFVSLSGGQLCAPFAVVGQPSKAVLSEEDVLSAPLVLPGCPLSLLLQLRHGSANTGTGARSTCATYHTYVHQCFFTRSVEANLIV